MKAVERIFWSIALPGFGQLLNKQYVKGLTFIFLEFLVNSCANFNEAIMLSFLGETGRALTSIDYGWLMFYPCLYFFAMWDAFKEAGGGKAPYSFLPFAFCAYFVTVGLMVAPKAIFFGVTFGPVFFPMICVIPGLIVGFLLRKIILTFGKNDALA